MRENIRTDFDYTNKDYTAFKAMMIAGLKQKMPEYTDLSDADAGIVIIELLAQGLDIVSYYNDVAANEAFFTTLKQRTNALKWCNIFGYNPAPATPAIFKQVFFLGSVKDVDIVIPAGSVVRAIEDDEEIYFQTSAPHIIPAGKLGNEMTGDTYDYTVDVVHGIAVTQEILGSSTGAPNQKFRLNYYPVIEDSIRIYVGNSVSYTTWTCVDSFMDSIPSDTHYMIQYTGLGETEIVFGDGVFGIIPPLGINNIISSYRAGGGTEGNVSAYKIVNFVNPIPSVETFNPFVAEVLGQDAEELSAIKMKAPNAMRTLWGALTLKDFGDIVVNNFPEVSDAVCTEDTTEDNLIIYIIMKSGFTLTNEYKTSIVDFFAENKGGRKIVGVNIITINAPNVIEVNISANLILESFYAEEDVKADIQTYVASYFKYFAETFRGYISLNQITRDILTIKKSGIEGARAFSIQTATKHAGTTSGSFSISPDMIMLNKGDVVKLNALTITTI